MHLATRNLGRMRCSLQSQRSVIAFSRSSISFSLRGPNATLRPKARECIISQAVADAPVLPQLDSTDTSSLRKRPPIYKVMLHNDNYNRREYVVKVLIKVIEGFSVDDAMQVMEEAHETGVAMVLACPQDEAEAYCENLKVNGLAVSIEPGC